MRIIGLLKDLISNWLLICLKLFKAYLSVTLNFGNTGMMGSVALFLHHWNFDLQMGKMSFLEF